MEGDWMFANVIAHTSAKTQLSSIRKFTSEMEKNNTLKVEELLKAIDEGPEEITLDQQEEYREAILDELHELEKTYPSLLRYSNVVLTYSIVEQYLVRIVKPHMMEKLGYEDLFELNPEFENELRKLRYKGSLLKRIGRYITKDMGIPFPFNSKEWDFIEDLNIIRNNIVHCNGRVYDDRDYKKLEKVIKSYSSINISNSCEIVIKQEFIIHMLNQVDVFLSLVFERVNQKSN
ncbi:hypothetical protein [Bacillus wiedmannii]|uniref:hypothetical protein n=2 Tax=Bacillus cereus group TaxID=86661 RepID=UPI00211D1EBD|nr:hypothetical protein [Bacillus wiedmannii]